MVKFLFCNAFRKNLASCRLDLTYSISFFDVIFFANASYSLLILIFGLILGLSSVTHLLSLNVTITSGIICSCSNDSSMILPGLGFNDLIIFIQSF